MQCDSHTPDVLTLQRPMDMKRAVSLCRLCFCVGLLLATFPWLWNWGFTSYEPQSYSSLEWRSTLVREKSTLAWRACPDNSTFFCSFLTVPLDYSNPTAPDNSVVAIRLYPASVSHSERLGTIFTNPGGPGTSGHATLLKNGPSLSAIFEGKFDIVGWDPRGVNMTTPRISCHSTELRRQLFLLSHESGDLGLNGLLASTANRTLMIASARSQLLTDLCRDVVGDKVLRSVTTVNVARDLEQMRKAVGEDGMFYWGFSYGTTLGATYAAMFPQHAKRIILDGVVFAPEQYTSLFEHGLSSADSTSQVLEGFVSNCVSAGPSGCALMRNEARNASELLKHIWDLVSRLQTSPLPVVHPNSHAVPSILRPADLLLSMFSVMLRPANWRMLAAALADLESGDGRAIAALSGIGGRNWDLRNLTDGERAIEAGWDAGREMGANEADMAVSCGDALLSPEGNDATWTKVWLDWHEQLVSANPLGGAIWLRKMMRCRHWARIRPPPERYEGKWKMGEDLKPPVHPILFVSNTYDPVSPLSSGRRMVEVFGKENSRLMQNDAYGHCSVSQPSTCIEKAIREYMINGTLPAEGTTCQPDDGIIFPLEDYSHIREDYEEGSDIGPQVLNHLSQTGIGTDGWQ
ncbi:TAP-like protein-domain-containing protein [Mycena sp. CBHHK59/15]|nr:TAP-like protein-domain-containing protein [Mycena sp. CBHHK59/15]